MDAIKLGKFIAERRNAKHLTQDEFAEKLGYDNSKKISRWECGNSIPDFIDLIKISEVLDVTLYELSICKKIKDKTILEATKDKIKTYRDFQKYNRQKKAIYIIALLFGILFGLTTLFTIQNYNTVEIYEIESLDENFIIAGNIVMTNNYKIFNLINIEYLGKNTEQLNINVKEVEFYILSEEKRMLNYYKNNKYNLKNLKLIEIIRTTAFSGKIYKDYKFDLSHLIFQIKYLTQDNKKESLEFNFKTLKKYANNFKGI